MFCHSIRIFCVWAGRRPLFKSCQARGTIRGRLLNRGLVRKMGTVFAVCVADFFSNMARKVIDFQSLLLGAFFMPVFGPGYWRVQLPILVPKYGLQARAKNAGALKRFHECLLSSASAEMRQDQVTLQEE